ncbi:MAG: protein phosphatase 2C domain-containing protein [Lachnospiraceae bacterium]|nr:protein phosphatase 2C domain-containing protein [Lachnospiraceae bacterium]
MKFDVYGYSDKGGRSHNEDSSGYAAGGGSGIFVVADGLGGHSYGELASACVKDVLLGEWSPDVSDRMSWIAEAIETANKKIMEIAAEKNTVLKSTVVALAIDGTKAVWAHSGDSRLYYFHDGEMAAYTDDHSVAYKKYKAGEIRREDIATDEDQSSLLRALGGKTRYEPVITECGRELEAGDAFLLCSDGAWEYIREEEMLTDLTGSQSAAEWGNAMLQRILSRVMIKNDNITLVTVRLVS